MLTPGDWPAWRPPRIRLLTPPPTGAAEAVWQANVASALGGGEAENTGDPHRGVVGLGLSTAMDPSLVAGICPAALLTSPTDSELPASAASRLQLIAEAAGVHVVPPSDISRRSLRAATVATWQALGAIRSVSVVVPNYNYGRYIEDRLRQVDGQTHPVSEIIVLDDASTDESVSLIQRLLPNLIAPARFISSDCNSGSAFRQWEKGVRAATGELVWIAEADDRATPDFLAHLAPAFDDPAVVMAQTQSRQIGPDGEIRYDDYGFYLSEVGAERWAQSYRTDGREHAASTLAVMNTIPNVSAVLFRRDALLAALDACAPALETFRLAGDWLVYLEVISRGDFAFARQALNDHRVHEASVTTSALSPLNRALEVGRMQKIARDRMSPPPEITAAATVYLQKLYDYFVLTEGASAHVFDHPAFAGLAPDR